MKNQFDRKAANEIIRVIESTPISYLSGHDIGFDISAASTSFESLHIFEFRGEYRLVAGEECIFLSDFDWLDRRRILKALKKARKAFQAQQISQHSDNFRKRQQDNLNSIIPKLGDL